LKSRFTTKGNFTFVVPIGLPVYAVTEITVKTNLRAWAGVDAQLQWKIMDFSSNAV